MAKTKSRAKRVPGAVQSFRGWMRNMVFDLTYSTDFTDSTETPK